MLRRATLAEVFETVGDADMAVSRGSAAVMAASEVETAVSSLGSCVTTSEAVAAIIADSGDVVGVESVSAAEPGSDAGAVAGTAVAGLESGGIDWLHDARTIKEKRVNHERLRRRNEKLILTVTAIFNLHLQK